MAERSIDSARELSPLRKTTSAQSVDALVREQLQHFSLDPDSPLGRELAEVAGHVYRANQAMHGLWDATVAQLAALDRSDRIAFWNAKRFLCFQLAKLLDTLQNPLRKTWQSLAPERGSPAQRGPYAMFDNVTAIFSSTPVITRTATYLYACTEWIDDAFQGKELLHEIYSRLMNPTSTCLANFIVDVEAGPLAGEYFAWNFNSGMAAIDAVLAHLVGYRDIVLSSRNVYGGAHQLLADWYGKRSNLDVAVEWFDGFEARDFELALAQLRIVHADRLAQGRHIYVYLESPCNPHGYVLDVPAICRAAHAAGLEVICDSTVGTPFLHPVLRRADPRERPDFVIHSYTKDLVGNGTTTAGVAIARNERMFLPKGSQATVDSLAGGKRRIDWSETLFWNVYYVKGAFLDADKAFEVINGMRTLELRMLQKCISTTALARALARHPDIRVHCNAVPGNENQKLAERLLTLGLSAPLFTISFEAPGSDQPAVPIPAFKRFFDCLEPAFGLQVSLGQVNTVVLCPAQTSHSELSPEALRAASISPTTIRIAVGDEDPRVLLAHFQRAAELALDPVRPGFSSRFPAPEEVDALYRSIYLDTHERWLRAQPTMAELLR
jgi:O-acetylhomoserine/O-acetylserine sulfhydrylase-like pyridoxal-dependent enzyme